MKTRITSVFFAVLILMTSASRSQAQTSGSLFFIKVDGINGESTQPGHLNEIDVFSFNLGVVQRGITDFGGGAGVGKSQFLPVTIYKNVDVSSPGLFLACATGQHIKKVELKATRRNDEGDLLEYLTVTLSDVLVSSVNHQSADGNQGATVLETAALNYAKIEISYRKQNPNGTLEAAIKAGYDVKANKKLAP